MEICGDELTLVHLIRLDNDHVQRDIMCQAILSGKLCMISYVDLRVVIRLWRGLWRLLICLWLVIVIGLFHLYKINEMVEHIGLLLVKIQVLLME